MSGPIDLPRTVGEERRVRRTQLEASIAALERQQAEIPGGGITPQQLLGQPFADTAAMFLRTASPKRTRAILVLLGEFTLADRRLAFIPHAPPYLV